MSAERIVLVIGVAVGVLTHECDADYERGRQLIAEHQPTP
jgi:hypothetical protein